MRPLARLTAGMRRLLVALVALCALAVLLVGVPWGLTAYIGWPLPDHIPTRDEIEATLLNPLSVTLLLDILACLAWPTWLVFTVDVARCLPDALRGVRPPAIGPVHAVAGVLVASAVLGLLHPRAAEGAGPVPSAGPALAVATAQVEFPNVAVTGVAPHAAARADPHPQQGAVVVQPPHGGIHDSLWRIAERELGDGRHWNELFQLNQGRLQPDGDALIDPHLIRPGWVLQLPADAVAQPASPPQSEPAPHEPASPHPSPSQPPVVQPSPDAVPDRHRAPAPHAVSTTSGTAITLWSGGLVAASMASAVTLAMVIRRRKRRRAYQPGSGDRMPPPAPAPAVHALRLAYDEEHLDDSDNHEEHVTLDTLLPQVSAPISVEPSTNDNGSIEIGVREQRARAVNLAAVRGLGLTGAGAEATARSLLVHLLATTNATVIIPADDARALLGDDLPDSARLHVTNDLPSAITALGQHGSRRGSKDEITALVAVLVAQIDGPEPRLQSILDAGSGSGIAGIVLGHWRPGATVRVRADGIVAAASPTVDALRGTHLFHLDTSDTRDLLALLAHTPAPSTPPPGPAEPAVEEHGFGGRELEDAAEAEWAQSHVESDEDELAAPEQALDRAPAEPSEHLGNSAQTQETDASRALKSDAGTPAGLPAAEEAASTGREGAVTANVPDLIGEHEQPCEHPERPWALSIFGPITLSWRSPDGHDHDVTSALAPKHKALLVFLALHPSGTTRDAVREALWPDARGRRPFNAFYASLSQLRKASAIATADQAVDLISQHGEQVALDPGVVEVDYWQLHDAEHARRMAASDEERMTAWSRIAAIYHGEIADGMSALWLEGPREAAHRSVVDALAGMAAHYRGRDPQRQLQLLEHARLLNPENEHIYRDIMRVQAQLGLTDAIARTVQLLTTTLAEIGERPDPTTLMLARTLQTRQRQEVS
ncbi:hypothetical protein GCM10012275_59730 [Longimycelium tulufanense]|uniref:Bacterial transcriptional activator domain-containing protein n=1 Tax=Longimycelium tulufanense TaxID=907463 RepID=A0A8J3CKB9_9PSEU|nr:hypothetical protein [Longimycelium tulufanense]GGM81113.1 hypothetical protein GCM10012275_59730 [Longimycelium tulufanense]